MAAISAVLTVLACAAALALVLVVLLQEARGGGIAAFSGTGAPVFDTSTAPVRRLTSVLAGTWIGACTVLSLIAG